MIPLIPLALGLAEAIPSIAGWFGGDDAEESAKSVISIAKKVTGIDDAPDAVAAVKADPEYLLKVEQMAMQERINQLTQVNKTMRAEADAEDPWTRRWRPYWGFVSGTAFGLVAFAIVIAFLVMAITDTSNFIAQLPAVIGALTALFGIPGAILGVTAWQRGKMQRIQAGEVVDIRKLVKSLKE